MAFADLRGNSTVFKAPTIQIFAIALNYTFTVTAANATVGAIYTNNGQTFTVIYTIAGGTTLVCSGTGAPAASGTLTKSAGTGDSTITFASVAANGTYITPTSPAPLYIRVKAVGGGGGGGGSCTNGNNTTAGSAGGNTTFGTSLITANGGQGAPSNTGGASTATGGTVTINSPAVTVVSQAGSRGGTATNGASTAILAHGGHGGNTPYFAGGAPGGTPNNAGVNSTSPGGGGGAGAPGENVVVVVSPSGNTNCWILKVIPVSGL